MIVKVREGVSIWLDAGGVRAARAGVAFAPSVSEASNTIGEATHRFDVRAVRPVFESGKFARPALAARIGLDRYYVIEIGAGHDVESFAYAVGQFGQFFERVDPDRVGESLSRGKEDNEAPWPSDPFFGDQWGLQNTGQTTMCSTHAGLPGADISAVPAWALYLGNQSIVIAVIDGGVNEHRDLVGRLVPGQNFAGGPPDATGHMNNNHGTFIAGIAAAIPNNGIAIAGVSWDARIMPIRVFNDFQIGFEAQVSDGIVWAADHGADILNMSLGFGSNGNATSLLHDAVIYAHDSGALLVASTGNVVTQTVRYPAAFPEVIGVGATNNQDEIWSNSTQGPEVSVVAPGGGIVSLLDTPSSPDSVMCDTGTSAAAAFVSGVGALVWARYPQLTNDAVQAIIEATADDLGEPGKDDVFGWGRVNAEAALAFFTGGGVPVQRPTCVGDLNGDHMINISDLLLYLQLFNDGAPGADLAPPHGVFDFADILAYLLRFVGGCGAGASGL
ncbi:MAG: S8 family serine peptidase [Phycisphaerales bacterium]